MKLGANTTSFVTLLASVCFRFRQVILSTPSCWSNIWIDAGTKVDIDTTDNSRIRTLFKRSKSAPLQLTWKVEDGFYEDIAKWKNPYTALLSHHAHRIRALAFLTPYTVDALISLFGEASLPNLRHFRIVGEDLDWGHTTLHNWAALQAPLLTLEITDRRMSYALALPSFSTLFNTTALTNLALETPIRLQDVVAFLKCCPSLEVLNLECQRNENTSDMLNSLSGYDFGHLRELVLQNGALGTLLQQTNTPKLQELNLFGATHRRSFIAKQATQLSVVSIYTTRLRSRASALSLVALGTSKTSLCTQDGQLWPKRWSASSRKLLGGGGRR